NVVLGVEDPAVQEPVGLDVPARVPVGDGPGPGLTLGPTQRHGVDAQVDAESGEDVLLVPAVVEGSAVGRDPRIEGPVVQLDPAVAAVGELALDLSVQ